MIKIQLLKGSLVFLFLACLVQVKSQEYVNPNKIKINYKDSSVIFTLTKETLSKVKKNTMYFWYKEEALHCSEFGYSGYLLDGLYTAYYKGGDIKSKGYFKKGVKVGMWKYWDENGKISTVLDFNHSFFKKIFKRNARINDAVKTIDANETQ